MPSRFAAFDERHRRHDAELSVRLAGEDDLAPLAQLAEAHSGVSGGWAERLEADLSDDDRALFVAEVEQAVAGYGRVRWFSPPPGSPTATGPAGWYLGGLVVAPAWRGCGAGAALTWARVGWVAESADEVWHYANARNAVSLALHAAVGFEEVTRDFSVPGVSFDGGVGVLCRLRLRPERAGGDHGSGRW
ncbi:MAG: GNAT family N-acetyltransferase [Acidimicrobiales bacterium]